MSFPQSWGRFLGTSLWSVGVVSPRRKDLGMCVESALGITAEMAMEIVERRWPDWVAARPSLAGLDPLQAGRWLRGTSPTACAARYEVAVLAAEDGGDDVDAASVLAWAMLPAACRVARGLADLDERIDDLVASQLWIEVRTYNWRSGTHVAGTIRANLRRHLLRDLRPDLVNPRRERLAPSVDLFDDLPEEPAVVEVDPRLLLLRVLDWGVAHRVITSAERRLLLLMADRASSEPARANSRRSLLAVSAAVAPKLGVHPRTVRRQGRRALDALAAHADDIRLVVAPFASHSWPLCA